MSSIGHNSLWSGRRSGLLEAGIYLTPHFYKAWGYSDWFSGQRTVLMCAVKLGKVIDSKDCVQHAPDCDKHPWETRCLKQCNYLQPNASNIRRLGAHTAAAFSGPHPGAWSGRLNFSEYCVYDEKRVLPLFVLVFEPI